LVAIPCVFDKNPKMSYFPCKNAFYNKTAEIKRNHQIPELKMIVKNNLIFLLCKRLKIESSKNVVAYDEN
jgi:hypothetical protein